jgi:hypothetical protein
MPDFIQIGGVKQPTKKAGLTRSKVKMGEVFRVKRGNGQGWGTKLYAHMGTRTVPPSEEVRFQSLNVKSGEESSSANGNSSVEIVGVWKLGVTLHAKFAHLG